MTFFISSKIILMLYKLLFSNMHCFLGVRICFRHKQRKTAHIGGCGRFVASLYYNNSSTRSECEFTFKIHQILCLLYHLYVKSLMFVLNHKNRLAKDFMKKVTLYTTNEEVLKRMLTEENAIDWSTYFLIGGMTCRYI